MAQRPGASGTLAPVWVEQQYFPSVVAVTAANMVVPGLGAQRPEIWYVAYVARVEALCHPS
jgi:hypothetical protein